MSSRKTCHILRQKPFPRTLSLVIPLYNEEEVFPLLRSEVTKFMDEFPARVEVVLVNDGSRDRTVELAALWAGSDSRIVVLQLARNFGHQLAATAGLDNASGDAVVLMDADLQDPLSVIHRMVDCYCQGYHVVYGQRERRQGESVFKTATAWLFYRGMRRFVSRDLPVDTGDFRLLSRESLHALNEMRETHRFLRGMASWIGFAECAVRYERAPRAAGETKYPLSKMFKLAWTAATSFSTIPLRLSIYLAIVTGIFGLEEAVRALITRFLGTTVAGWTSLMIVTALVGSAILFCLGILGQYVGMIFEQSKSRPLYLISERIGGQNAAVIPAGHGIERPGTGARAASA